MAKKSKKSEPAPKGKPAAKEAAKPEPKPIQPAPKVVFNIDSAGAEKLERLTSFMGTIYLRKQKYTTDRKAAFENRDATQKELAALGLEAQEARTPEYLKLRADLGETLDSIATLDALIKACNNSYDKLAGECSEGKFAFAELTIDELLEDASKKSGQMTLADLKGNGTLPGPGSSWKKIHAARPDLFGGREWSAVHKFTAKLEDLRAGAIPCDNPLVLANYLVQKFNEPDLTTKDRESVLPAAPAWFHQALRAVMAEAAEGNLGSPDSEEHATDAESMLNRFERCADADPDAWLAIAGGADGAMNKLILAAAE
jgi:hypothetical protein